MSKDWTASDFKAVTDKTMYIQFDHQNKLSTEILDIKEYEKYKYNDKSPFSVTFLVKNSKVWPQSIYTLEFPDSSQLEIFLVPIGPHENGIKYEAVFS